MVIQMNRSEYYNSLYLAHHGVKGQKWGVRRYQNEDGSYTDLGAKRRRSDGKSGISDKAKTALKIGGAVAGTALAVYGAYKLRQAVDIPYVTHMTMKNAKSAIDTFKGTSAGEKVGKALKDSKAFAGKTIKDAGKAAFTAAVAAVGTIGVNKAVERYKDRDGDSEATKNANLIKRDATSAAIRSATGSVSRGANNKLGSNGVGSSLKFTNDEIRARVGAPHQTHAWSDPDTDKRYQTIMRQYSNDDETKKVIRAMRSAAYDIDQIEDMFR